MKMRRRRFRIGDLAKRLKIDKFVIRFWEKEFNLPSDRSEGGQRFYEEKDFETFQQIKTLLYEKKFTIAGAKKQLRTPPKNTHIIASKKTDITHAEQTTQVTRAHSCKQIIKKSLALKKNLVKLRKLLQ